MATAKRALDMEKRLLDERRQHELALAHKREAEAQQAAAAERDSVAAWQMEIATNYMKRVSALDTDVGHCTGFVGQIDLPDMDLDDVTEFPPLVSQTANEADAMPALVDSTPLIDVASGEVASVDVISPAPVAVAIVAPEPVVPVVESVAPVAAVTVVPVVAVPAAIHIVIVPPVVVASFWRSSGAAAARA